jgi:hypothetical protein
VRPNATAIVRAALAGSGVELVASCDIATYDAHAPGAFQSAQWMPGARGLVVVGSAGPTLWRQFRAQMDEDPRRWREPHPLDRFVGGILEHTDAALAAAHVAFRRFEPTLHATPRLDFVAMARLVGLGSDGPFGMLIHGEHGAWWALRGAWFVDADVDAPLAHRPPCRGCPAPCIGGWANANGARATPQTRKQCVVGQDSRYADDQIAYHYDRLATVARLGGR